MSDINCLTPDLVAPLAGAWIEILSSLSFLFYGIVAPLAGAWIEIAAGATLSGIQVRSLPLRERGLKLSCSRQSISCVVSLPLRERGLKSGRFTYKYLCSCVAPLAGAWIEIACPVSSPAFPSRRSPCGSVD